MSAAAGAGGVRGEGRLRRAGLAEDDAAHAEQPVAHVQRRQLGQVRARDAALVHDDAHRAAADGRESRERRSGSRRLTTTTSSAGARPRNASSSGSGTLAVLLQQLRSCASAPRPDCTSRRCDSGAATQARWSTVVCRQSARLAQASVDCAAARRRRPASPTHLCRRAPRGRGSSSTRTAGDPSPLRHEPRSAHRGAAHTRLRHAVNACPDTQCQFCAPRPSRPPLTCTDGCVGYVRGGFCDGGGPGSISAKCAHRLPRCGTGDGALPSRRRRRCDGRGGAVDGDLRGAPPALRGGPTVIANFRASERAARRCRANAERVDADVFAEPSRHSARGRPRPFGVRPAATSRTLRHIRRRGRATGLIRTATATAA